MNRAGSIVLGAGDEPHIGEPVQAFLENRRIDSERIPVLLAEHDLVEIRHIGHNMKSSGAGYGFAALATIGCRLEEAAVAEDEPRIRSLAAELERCLASVS